MSVEVSQPAPDARVPSTADPEAANAPESSFRPDIEGFRAVAVGLVVLYHAGIVRFSGGFVGVDIFFVISGFLITGLLIRDIERTGTVSLRRFYARRVRRLLPLSALVLGATAIASVLLVAPLDGATVGRDIVSAAAYVSNWRFALLSTDYLAADVNKSPVLQYWSLSVEEQYYVVWPLLLILLASRRGLLARLGLPLRLRIALPLAVLGLGSFALSALTSASSGPMAYFGLHTRAWELAAGAAVAVAAPHLPRLPRLLAYALGWVGLAAVLWSGMAYSESTTFPGTAAAVPVLGAVMLITAGFVLPQGGAGRVLGNRAFRYVGRISYAWYLWHWPCIIFTEILVRGTDAEAPVRHRYIALAVLLSFVLAALSHVLVENPARYSRWLSSNAWRSIGVGGLLTATSIAAGVAVVAWSNSAGASAGVMSPAAARADTVGSLGKCHLGFKGTTPKVCVYGDPNGTKTVAIIGDSHAAHLEPALDALGKQRHWKVILMTKSGCAWNETLVWALGLHSPYPSCLDWQPKLWATLRAHPVDLLLISRIGAYDSRVVDGSTRLTRWTPKAEQLYEAGTAKALAEIGTSAKRIVVLRDIPRPPGDIPGCLSEHPSDEQACAFRLTERALHPDDDISRAEAAVGGDRISFADFTASVCPGGVGALCRPRAADGVIKYRDEHHLTITFARSLAGAIGKAIDAAGPLAGRPSPAPTGSTAAG